MILHNSLLLLAGFGVWNAAGVFTMASGQVPLANPSASGQATSSSDQYQHPTFNTSSVEVDSAYEDDLAAESAPCKLTGRFHLQQGTTQGYLVLQCELPAGSYMHSLTLPEDLNPTVIRVLPVDTYSVRGSFHPDRPPTVVERDPVLDQRLEKHSGKVQFFVPIQVSDGIDVTELKPQMIFDGQVCSDQGVCVPLNGKVVTATFAGYFERTAENHSAAPDTRNK